MWVMVSWIITAAYIGISFIKGFAGDADVSTANWVIFLTWSGLLLPLTYSAFVHFRHWKSNCDATREPLVRAQFAYFFSSFCTILVWYVVQLYLDAYAEKFFEGRGGLWFSFIASLIADFAVNFYWLYKVRHYTMHYN